MTMDWPNERYVRVYTRDTADWLVLSWEARALWLALMRKFDRAGVLETRLGTRGVAVLVQMPADVVARALPELLADGCLVEHERGYYAPNYIPAQEAPSSDRQRAKESRERRRDRAAATKTGESQPVTAAHIESHAASNRDGAITERPKSSQPVTPSHNSSRDVTAGHAESQLVTPSQAVPDQPSQTSSSLAPARDPRTRGQCIEAVWAYALAQQMALKAKNIGTTQPCWPLHATGPLGADDLRDRIIGLENGDVKPDYAAIEATCRHVVDVVAAEADEKRNLEYFQPGRMWTKASFAISAGMTPAEARQRARDKSKRARAPIGAAPVANHHPVSEPPA